MHAEERAEQFRHAFTSLTGEIGKAVVGHQEIVRGVLICLFCGGHALLEGVPGLGKTLLVKTLAESLDLHFSRIQFTPDLMPADIIGTNIVVETPQGGRHFAFQRGPLFGQIVLADEINRATPKTQSALLEAMQELAVTAGGVHHPLERPFFVLATQNPIEMEGTYPLPEAQLDRFLLKLRVKYPSASDLAEIIERTTQPQAQQIQKVATSPEVETMKALVREVPIPQPVKEYVTQLVLSTRPEREGAPEMVRRFVRYGSSPRGAQALVLGAKVQALMDGRFNVSFEDVRQVALESLRHRLILSFEGEAEGIDPDQIIEDLLTRVPTSPAKVALLPDDL
ncbi:MAG TPA: MoxR family ATPase [Candidatus Methylomirabilis sp.]|nr:MoxR family ATPase [Candidatus Methylomirabilis sp.]